MFFVKSITNFVFLDLFRKIFYISKFLIYIFNLVALIFFFFTNYKLLLSIKSCSYNILNFSNYFSLLFFEFYFLSILSVSFSSKFFHYYFDSKNINPIECFYIIPFYKFLLKIELSFFLFLQRQVEYIRLVKYNEYVCSHIYLPSIIYMRKHFVQAS